MNLRCFRSLPVRCKSFSLRFQAGSNPTLASGYTGQTTETLALPADPLPFERIVGVPLKSYVSLSWIFYCKR
jgi:hypothetical protein